MLRGYGVCMPSDADSKEPVTLQTVERAFRFLETIALSSERLTVKDISRALGLNLTTCYHLFNTLQQTGYATRERDGTLRIGSRISVLNAAFRRQFSTARDLLPLVESLSKELQETAYLSRLTREGLVVQLQVEAEQALRVAGHGVGFVGQEHLRASGKAVMAFMATEAQERLLSSLLADKSKTAAAGTRRRLKAEFDEIRLRGWALDREEYQAGVCCVGAPFFGADDSVCGSIGVSLPAARYQVMHAEVSAAVLRTAAELSRMHGYEHSAAEADS